MTPYAFLIDGAIYCADCITPHSSDIEQSYYEHDEPYQQPDSGMCCGGCDHNMACKLQDWSRLESMGCPGEHHEGDPQ